MVLGLLGVAIGVYTFIYPTITTLALVYLIAAWAILRGVFGIVAAAELLGDSSSRVGWTLLLGGLISLALGAVLAALPSAGALAIVYVVGAFALTFGMTAIVLSFRLRALLHPSRRSAAEG